MKKLGIALLSLVLLWACKKDEDKYAPPAEFAVQVVLIEADSAQIVWTKSIDPDDYILVYDVYLQDTSRLKNSKDTSFTFRGLLPNTYYEGYVLAKDFSDGFTKAPFSFRTYNDLEQDSANFYVNAKEISDTTAQLSWGFNGVVGIKPSRYDVYLDGSLLQSGVTDTLFELTGLKSGTLYQGKIVAIDDSIGTVQRNYEFTTTGTQQAEGVVIIVDTSNVNQESATISWSVENHPTFTPQNYDVYLEGNQVVSSTLNTNYTFNNLMGETSYSGKIVARGFFGEEAQQNFSFTTTNGSSFIEIDTTGCIGKDRFAIRWEPVPASTTVDSYDIYVDDVLYQSGVTENTIDITGLDQGQNYNVKVVGNLPNSQTIEGTYVGYTSLEMLQAYVSVRDLGSGNYELIYEVGGINYCSSKQFEIENLDILIDGVLEADDIAPNPGPTYGTYPLNNLQPNTEYVFMVELFGVHGEVKVGTVVYTTNP